MRSVVVVIVSLVRRGIVTYSSLMWLMVAPILAQDFSRSETPSNQEFLRGTIQKAKAEIITFVCSVADSSASLHFSPHSQSWLVRSAIEDILMDTIRLQMNSTVLRVDDIACDIRYRWLENDSLERTALVKFSIRGEKSGDGLRTVEIFQSSQDIISESTAENFTRSGLALSSSPIPPKPKTFLQEYGEPILYVGGAVLTAILLFTVRSQ